jgi:leader peptidase (prepilin peptidase) / N-methyltransferase
MPDFSSLLSEAQPNIITAACFIIGTCTGSFLNVCIYRIPKDLSIISPGSCCPVCHSRIPFYLNIPILSYIFLKGRCASCKKMISIRYPLVEVLTGTLYVFIFFKSGISVETLYWYAFISVLITVSFIDIDYGIIPDRISLSGILIFSTAFLFLPEMTIFHSWTGGILGGGILYTIAAVFFFIRNKEGMGGGDIKLLAMIGMALGVKGVLFTVFCGSSLGAIAGGIMIFSQKRDINFRIPFAPFLSTGALIHIFYGNQIIKYYLKIAGVLWPNMQGIGHAAIVNYCKWPIT